MTRRALLVNLALAILGGCGHTGDLAPRGSPSWTYDDEKRMMMPSNDRDYWNGQPMDARTR